MQSNTGPYTEPCGTPQNTGLISYKAIQTADIAVRNAMHLSQRDENSG